MQNIREETEDYKMSFLLLLLFDAVETKKKLQRKICLLLLNSQQTRRSAKKQSTFYKRQQQHPRAHRGGKCSEQEDLIKNKIPSANKSYRSRAAARYGRTASNYCEHARHQLLCFLSALDPFSSTAIKAPILKSRKTKRTT